MNKFESEKEEQLKIKSLYYDEKTKVENLRGTISKLNTDVCNFNDLKSQGKDFFKKVHDEKIRFSNLNDQYNKAI